MVVLQGQLKVFYNFNGSLMELKPRNPQAAVKMSDGAARSVSVSYRSPPSSQTLWRLVLVTVTSVKASDVFVWLFPPVQLEIFIVRTTVHRILVKYNLDIITDSHVDDIPTFSNSFYLGGVPEDRMPETYVEQKHRPVTLESVHAAQPKHSCESQIY